MLDAITATHAGMTTEAFDRIAREWIRTKRDARFKRQPTSALVYQPMLELLDYLRANGFKTFIVSGGGVEFIRAFAEEAYGIPPDQVIGSSGRLNTRCAATCPSCSSCRRSMSSTTRTARSVGIQKFIGRRPIAAFGNSDGDLQMLNGRPPARAAPGSAGAPHRRDARMGLRPRIEDRHARQGTGHGRGEEVDRRQHEGRLERDIPEAVVADPVMAHLALEKRE